MARINLLPWREQLREERRKQFLVILGGIFVLSCGAVFLGDQYLSGEIARQEARNAFIQQNIAQLDVRIKEISELKTRRQQLLARMKIIQDLQARFSRPVSEVGKRTCIVIVELSSVHGRQVIGVLVDAVNEVLEIPDEAIASAPAFGSRIRSDFIRGIGKVDEKFVILLDVDQVFSVDELAALVDASADATV